MSSATVTAFPLHRQRRLLSGIARVLQSKQRDDATRFWRETAKSLLHQQMANGIDAQSAEEEVRTLLYAVLSEMEAHAAEARG